MKLNYIRDMLTPNQLTPCMSCNIATLFNIGIKQTSLKEHICILQYDTLLCDITDKQDSTGDIYYYKAPDEGYIYFKKTF